MSWADRRSYFRFFSANPFGNLLGNQFRNLFRNMCKIQISQNNFHLFIYQLPDKFFHPFKKQNQCHSLNAPNLGVNSECFCVLLRIWIKNPKFGVGENSASPSGKHECLDLHPYKVEVSWVSAVWVPAVSVVTTGDHCEGTLTLTWYVHCSLSQITIYYMTKIWNYFQIKHVDKKLNFSSQFKVVKRRLESLKRDKVSR